MEEKRIRLEYRPIDELIPYEHNAKLHPPEQIEKLARSFDEFGRIVPAGIDAAGNLIFGHGRILAARQRGDKDFPCVVINHLSETQRRAFVHADNLLAESGTDETILRAEMQALHAAGFDVTITGFDPAGLRLGGSEETADAADKPFWGDVEAESSEEYDAFVEKYKHKLTTDDVYTPDNIYSAVRDFAVEHYQLQGAPIVRPFYPGGDYKSADYPEGCVVIDNPPFSILSEICAWYEEHGVNYFLFAPAMTLFSTGSGALKYLPVNANVVYTNGASIGTSFVTSLGSWKVELCPELYSTMDEANTENLRALHRKVPTYIYDDHVISGALLNRLVKYGQALRIPGAEVSFVRTLDAQREAGKTIYGGGFLLSEKAAAEKAAAEKAAATAWPLSDRERAIVAALSAEASHG